MAFAVVFNVAGSQMLRLQIGYGVALQLAGCVAIILECICLPSDRRISFAGNLEFKDLQSTMNSEFSWNKYKARRICGPSNSELFNVLHFLVE